MVTFPSPRPSPLGRGGTLLAAGHSPDLWAFPARCALSPEGEGQGEGEWRRTIHSRIGPLAKPDVPQNDNEIEFLFVGRNLIPCPRRQITPRPGPRRRRRNTCAPWD